MKINLSLFKILLFFLGTCLFSGSCIYAQEKSEIGDVIDNHNGVAVYYNGDLNTINGRNETDDGYNLGLKYQCVEFVKRYYYEVLNHKMPNTFGNGIDFFDLNLNDGQFNRTRNLFQYTNPSSTKPKKNDILIFENTDKNPYGHVAIVTKVTADSLEIIQQNPDEKGAESREKMKIVHENEQWKIKNNRVLGWLRKED